MQSDEHEHEGEDHHLGVEVAGRGALPYAVPFRVDDAGAAGGDGRAVFHRGGGHWVKGLDGYGVRSAREVGKVCGRQ